MNERTIQLYKQAVDFAYTTAGKDAGKGTVVESLTAGKFAELIVRECAGKVDFILREKKAGPSGLLLGQILSRAGISTLGDEIREHFGVEE